MDEIERMKRIAEAQAEQAESEKKQAASQAIQKQKIKTATTIFVMVVIFIQVILMLAVLFIFYIAEAFIIFRILNQTTGTVFQMISPVVFIGSLIVGFLLSRKLISFAAKKLNLKGKINDDVLNQYTNVPKFGRKK